MFPVDPEVCQITIDFEKALWSVLRLLLPDVKIKGCVFHWTQALFLLNNCFLIAAKPEGMIQTVNLSKQSKINAELIDRIQISKLLHFSCPQF